MTVSDFPITPQGMAAVLHNETSGHALLPGRRRPMRRRSAWSRIPTPSADIAGRSGKGPPVRLTSGTLTRAEITTRRQRPLDLVVPLIKRLTGIDG